MTSAPGSRMASPYRTPAGTEEFGVMIAMVSTAIAFGAGAAAYVVMAHRFQLAVRMPQVLWLSTLVILLSSAMLHYALLSAQARHRVATRRAVTAAAALGVLFVALQAPGLTRLLADHVALEQRHILHYGTAIVLIVLHAVHVVGGLVPLSIITGRLRRGVITDATGPLRLMSLYWHLLTVVWLGLFLMFMLAG